MENRNISIGNETGLEGFCYKESDGSLGVDIRTILKIFGILW